MFRRKSGIFLFYLSINIIMFSLILIHASFKQHGAGPLLREKINMVKRFELTDLCLFTDAQYTRHPSMTDLTTPFQEHPMSPEHFPSGSLLPPPPHLRSYGSAR